jgi:crotonobetainyl-CoA:carnitine CoA-transferase CaiB-like acyl-CoA transferase
VLHAELGRRPAVEWVPIIGSAGIPCGVVNDIAQAFELAESLGLEPVLRLSRSGEATVAVASEPSGESQVRNPMVFSRTPPTYRLAPPVLGEHTDAVEEELGLA